MKQKFAAAFVLIIAGLAFWFLTKDTPVIIIDDKSSVSNTQQLVPPSLPE